MGKWRAGALILVYVLMIAHFVQWRVSGRTVSPIEPSEAMDTLRSGAINAGAVFFAVALAATLVFGRFVCGWACHIVAVQDLCTWLLKRAGLRPKPFRSRLLVFVPLVAAFYMFVWPVVHRLWFGYSGPDLHWALTRADFWGTFPGPLIAVLTFVVCGFGIVWFLGNKGFCTYACPYGGFFGPLDKLSPMRVRVTDACNQCGHCTAVCTSNVRVAEEVKLFRAVVDPGCMKCMDCVSVCPNDALYVGWGRPALGVRASGTRKPIRYDATWAGEVAMGVVFVAAMLCWRGLYGEVPFLFSLGLAAISTFVVMKAWQLFARRDLTLHGMVLKKGGRIRGSGAVFGGCAALLAAFLVHSGLIQFHAWRGAESFAGTAPAVTGWPMARSLTGLPTAEERAAAGAARRHLEFVERWGLGEMPGTAASLAWLDLLDGKPESAERRLRDVAARSADSAGVRMSLGEVLLLQGRLDDARSELSRAVELDPKLAAAEFSLGVALLKGGDEAGAVTHLERARRVDASPGGELPPLWEWYYAEALRRAGKVDESVMIEFAGHGDPATKTAALRRAVGLMPEAGFLQRGLCVELARSGDLTGAGTAIGRALRIEPGDFNALMHAGQLAFERGDSEAALRFYGEAERIAPASWLVPLQQAAALVMVQRYDEAIARGREAARRNPSSAEARATTGAALISKGDVTGSLAEYREAVRLEPGNWEYRLRVGFLLGQMGQREEALAELRVVAGCPDSKIAEAAKQMIGELSGR